MIKVRSGIFETNSSSTHTCVLTDYNTYMRWCKKELVFVEKSEYKELNIFDLVKKYSNPEYIIDEDFIDVRAFNDITLENVFEGSSWLIKKYDPKSKGVFLKEIWDLYNEFDYKGIEEGEIDFEKCYKAVLKKNPRIELIQDLMNKISDYPVANGTVTYDTWNYFFKLILCVYTVNNLCNSWGEQEDFKRKTIDGKDIVAFCTYGHD